MGKRSYILIFCLLIYACGHATADTVINDVTECDQLISEVDTGGDLILHPLPTYADVEREYRYYGGTLDIIYGFITKVDGKYHAYYQRCDLETKGHELTHYELEKSGVTHLLGIAVFQ